MASDAPANPAVTETAKVDAPEGVTAGTKRSAGDAELEDHSVSEKGKGKRPATAEEPEENGAAHVGEDDEEDDDEEEEEGDDDDDDDGEDDEDFEEIDPTAIRNRRTRGKKVDYTSAEALEKAGLTTAELNDDDE